MKKIEYPEDLMKCVDTFSEMHVIRKLIGKYLMIKKLMYEVKRNENPMSRLPDDLITKLRGRIQELIEKRDFLNANEDDIRQRIVDCLGALLNGKIWHMERCDYAWNLDEYIAVEKVEWYGPVDIDIHGKVYRLDCNYNLIKEDCRILFPVWADTPEALTHEGPHYKNLLPLLSEMAGEDEVKLSLLGETFNF